VCGGILAEIRGGKRRPSRNDTVRKLGPATIARTSASTMAGDLFVVEACGFVR